MKDLLYQNIEKFSVISVIQCYYKCYFILTENARPHSILLPQFNQNKQVL